MNEDVQKVRQASIEPVRYGATQQEWHHFSKTLGLTVDLLPVVSDPSKQVSAHSKLTAFTKTPSRLTPTGFVVGIPGWTGHCATPLHIKRWMAEPSHGISVITRRVRALDVDIADVARSAEVKNTIEMLFGPLPCRSRSNSGKLLLAFIVSNDNGATCVPLRKRVVKTEHGNIELLADGQQFIAVGTHASGVRYEWSTAGTPGLAQRIPVVTLDEFNACWLALSALGDSVEMAEIGSAPIKPRSLGDANDALVSWLFDNGMAKAQDQTTGAVHICCPFADGHSTGDADNLSGTDTTYFPAGVGGFAKGHFKCLHASCAGRTDSDFLHAMGAQAAEFEGAAGDVGSVGVDVNDRELPTFERNKSGRIKANRNNLHLALSNPHVCDINLQYDTFTNKVSLSWAGTQGFNLITDNDCHAILTRLESGRNGFEPIGKELGRDAISYAANGNRMDSAQQWLSQIHWDGTARVKTFLEDYFALPPGTDVEYVRAVSSYLWTALAGRTLRPGAKADMVPVFVGAQGAGKSSIIQAIAPKAEQFDSFDIGGSTAELIRKMRGRVVIELGEMSGMKKKEIAELKQFISTQVDELRPLYSEHVQSMPRRCLFIGTTNIHDFLPDDESGHRRFLPVTVAARPVGEVIAATNRLRAENKQLWAEGAVLFLQGKNEGAQKAQDVLANWKFDQAYTGKAVSASSIAWESAEQLAKAQTVKYEALEEWAEKLGPWLNDPANYEMLDGNPHSGFKAIDLAHAALNITPANYGRIQSLRIAKALRQLDYELIAKKTDGRVVKVWLRKQTDEDLF